MSMSFVFNRLSNPAPMRPKLSLNPDASPAQSKVYFLDAVRPKAEKAGASFMDARQGSL